MLGPLTQLLSFESQLDVDITYHFGVQVFKQLVRGNGGSLSILAVK